MQDHKNLRKKQKYFCQNPFLGQNNVNNFNPFQLMGSAKLIWVIIYCLVVSNASAQKQWDGESLDGQWLSPKNWFPDGVPSANDDILLNNDFIKTSYRVMLPPSNSSVTGSQLTLMPSTKCTITLEVPETNTASPAMNVNGILIRKGGELLNRSGATAGNTFLINGNIIIQNEGKYIHQTMRGNSYLISKLIHQEGTEKGIIIIDVPGAAGYLMSLSGRTFGTLQFSTDSSIATKSYSGSGSNDLIILGELIINKNVFFKSTLSGNIQVKGGLTNHGTFVMAPSTADTNKRQLVFNGDSTYFNSTGGFQQNSNFNGVKVATGSALKLYSPLILSNPTTMILVSANARFEPGDYYIQGGQFYSDSASTIFITSKDGISREPEKGNIRVNQINLSTKSSVVFCGNIDQESGDFFPDSISAITINKHVGKLTLSKHLHVIDSIALYAGNVISSSKATLSFSGKQIFPNEIDIRLTTGKYKGLIEGPFTYHTDSEVLISFPIGKDKVYAPLLLRKEKGIPTTYRVEYFKEKTTMYNSLKNYPLYKIDSTQYWEIQLLGPLSAVENKSAISINTSMNTLRSSFNEQCFAYFESASNQWKSILTTTQDPNIGITTTIPFKLTESLYTYGESRMDVLPLVGIIAGASLRNNIIKLSWKNYMNSKTKFYQIEISDDAKLFKPYSIVYEKGNSANQSYDFQFNIEGYAERFIRICAIDEFNLSHCSNIIHIKNDLDIQLPYPNPATNEINLIINKQEDQVCCWTIDALGRRKKSAVEQKNNYFKIKTENLMPGKYTLQYSSKGNYSSFPFIKK